MMAYTCNSSSQDAEAGGLQVQDQLGQLSKTLSKNEKKKKKD
jgi:hypothetical protein